MIIGGFNFSKYWAPLFSAISTTDSQALVKYEHLGVKMLLKPNGRQIIFCTFPNPC